MTASAIDVITSAWIGHLTRRCLCHSSFLDCSRVRLVVQQSDQRCRRAVHNGGKNEQDDGDLVRYGKSRLRDERKYERDERLFDGACALYSSRRVAHVSKSNFTFSCFAVY